MNVQNVGLNAEEKDGFRVICICVMKRRSVETDFILRDGQLAETRVKQWFLHSLTSVCSIFLKSVSASPVRYCHLYNGALLRVCRPS